LKLHGDLLCGNVRDGKRVVVGGDFEAGEEHLRNHHERVGARMLARNAHSERGKRAMGFEGPAESTRELD